MVNNQWAFDLENYIYTIIKVRAEKKLKPTYPNIHFTQTDLPKDATIRYPTVYLRELGGGAEQGRTTEGNEINGVFFTMQCDVTTDKSKKEAKAVNTAIALLFKDIGFGIVAFPEASTIGNNYVSNLRVRKMIGNTDTI